MIFAIIGIITVFVIIAIIIVVVAVKYSLSDNQKSKPHETSRNNSPGFWEWIFTPGYKKAGIRGEEVVVNAIKSVLREDDQLFTNVSIEYDGKLTELDIVIVNRYGVFIIEVKNYVGYIVGNEDDYEWKKYKTTYASNTYEKLVKNPIRQVKRQIYILAKYIEYYGPRVWVKGYAILLNGNSPVESEYILTSVSDIDRAIHAQDRRMLNKETVENIKKLLS